MEQMFDRFREFARKLFEEFAEPRSLAMVVNWEIGQTDFPAGIVVTQTKDPDPHVLIEMSEQLGKMQVRALEIFRDSLVETENELAKALKEATREYQKSAAAGAAAEVAARAE